MSPGEHFEIQLNKAIEMLEKLHLTLRNEVFTACFKV